MCERLVNTIHRLTFRQKQTEPPKAGGGTADASETDEEEAISTHGRLIKIHGPDQRSKPQAMVPAHGHTEKPRRSNSINKKVDAFIARTKMKIRSASGVGSLSHPPT